MTKEPSSHNEQQPSPAPLPNDPSRPDPVQQAEPAPQPDSVGQSEAVAQPDPGVNVMQALGGKQGMADGGLPGAVFVTVYTVSGQELTPALWSALAVAGVLTAIRLVRRQPLQYAVAGLVGVGVAAFFASRSGEAKNFFLPGLLLQGGYGLLYLVSILVRWPLIGVVVGPLIGEGMTWRTNPGRRRAYTYATWIWFSMFMIRLAVQLPLYLLDKPVALGYVKLLLGWPLVALAAWLTYRLLKVAPPPTPTESPTTAAPPQSAQSPPATDPPE